MSNDGPVDLSVLELVHGDFTSESTVGLVEDVLGSHADLLVGDLASEKQVEGGRGDDDLGRLVELGVVEVLDDAGNAFRSTVPVLGKKEKRIRSVIGRFGGWTGHSRRMAFIFSGEVATAGQW